MSAPRFRAGLVGAGYVAEFHVKALARLPQVELVGLTDLDAARARATAGRLGVARVFDSLAEMLDTGVGVVHVLTPPDAHAAVALEALERGCDVLVEKPLATSVEDCDRLLAAVARTQRRACVNHSLLGDPQIRRALAAARGGAVGELVAVDVFCSSVYPPWAGGPLPPQYRDGGYPFRDLGVHALYVLREFLGPIRDVRADFGTRGGDPNLCFDEWRAAVDCEGGTGQIRLSWNVNPLQHFLLVHGTRGTLRVDLALMFATRRRSLPIPKAAERVVNAMTDALPPLWQVPLNVGRFVTGRLQPYQGLHTLVADFYASLAGEGPMPAPFEAGREVVRWTEHAAAPADAAKRTRMARFVASGEPAVVVTGASGYLGRHLVRRLLAAGERVRVLVRRPPSDADGNPRLEIVLGDLGDPAAVDAAVRGATTVFHVGAAMGGDREAFERGTVAGTRHVIESCLRHGVARLVHVSSLSVLDWAGLHGGPPVTESAALEPHPEARGLYTQTKLAAERLVHTAVRDRALRAVVLRPGQLFGGDGPLVAATGALEIGRTLVVLGDGTAPLPLVHVEDVVDALLLAARRPTADGAVFQLVDESPITQRELTERVATATDRPVRRIPGAVVWALASALALLGRLLGRSVPLTPYRLRSAQAHLRFDCTKAGTELGWHPRIGVGAGLVELLEGGLAHSAERISPTSAPQSPTS